MAWEAAIKNALDNPEITWPDDVDPAALRKGKRNKFNAQRCVAFGDMKFDSKAEMAVYGEYRLLEMTGAISELKHHPVLELPAGVKYEADFRFVENGQVVIVDIKGGKATQTAAFKLKWRQAKELYPQYEFRLIEK